MITKNEKIGLAIAIILLLWLLFRKKIAASGDSTSFVIDPATGLKIGYPGVSGDSASAGEIVLPPGIPNDIGNAAFQYTVQNPPVALCPAGYDAVIDPQNGKAFCLLTGYGASQTAAGGF